MAFGIENNIFDYCSETFKKYQNDNLIFFKTLQILEYFKTRDDYPYCTDELSQIMERMLGYDLGTITDFLWRYVVKFGKEMIWDIEHTVMDEINITMDKEETDILVSNFKNDMESFFIAATPLFEELFIGEVSSTRIKKIALKQTYGDEKSIRIVRKDGETFDFSVNTNDINNIIDVFSSIK